ncbi:MAG: electron transfer flavoprotein subunit alpha/FixB family protein [Bifidobacteriaceae bacterium]|jgi:electron transfer flavoprotein alpha subunit|nr:electron transfer flavoprotein subunit alpha/FixB family protein [Bifidobacteriaceae bacterium]
MTTGQVWVIVTDDLIVGNALAVARGLGGPVTALVVGSRQTADRLAPVVSQVRHLAIDQDTPAESCAAGLADLAAAEAPAAVVGNAGATSRALLGAVAARLGGPVLHHVTSAALKDGQISLVRTVGGGLAEVAEAVDVGQAVLAVRGGSDLGEAGATAPVAELAVTSSSAVRLTSAQSINHQAVELGSAKVVVGVGRGMKAQADVAMVRDLAERLGAELACSRPLAEGAEWFGHDRYIGVSGQTIAPDLYLAVGLSGQVQHLSGAHGAKLIIAINNDPDAPVMTNCDLAMVADLYQAVPALTAALGGASGVSESGGK